MRICLVFRQVDPHITPPTRCVNPACLGRVFRLHQPVSKALRDMVYHEVQVYRYQCLRCKHTFRVYPAGVSPSHISDRVKELAVLLYLLGLSYGAVSLALVSLGVSLSKTQVYQTVQAAAARIPDVKRALVFSGPKTKAPGGELTSAKCGGQWLHLELRVDALMGLVLTIDELAAEDVNVLKAWIEPIARSVGAEVRVAQRREDADGFKTATGETWLLYHVCKSHVKRKSRTLIDEFRPLVADDRDGSLQSIGVTPAQALGDLDRLGELITSCCTAQGDELKQLQQYYLSARPPRRGEHQSLAYRLRLLFLDHWDQ